MIGISVLIAFSLGLLTWGVMNASHHLPVSPTIFQKEWHHYVKQFTRPLGHPTAPTRFHHNAAITTVTCIGALLAAGIVFMNWLLIITGIVSFILPWGIHGRNQKKTIAQMDTQMDNTLANLANAVSVSGNLHNAIEAVAEGEAEPMRSSLQYALHEIRLGKTEEEALQRFADRSQLPLLKTAVTAVIVGKQSGGHLGNILSSTAQSIREIKRLEGVLKVKTAEGRNQAWVMGMVPLFLCGILQVINPEWLAPMWSTPVGWGLLVVCVALEGLAILLIRKILMVTL